ncbi:hypothetical protein PpBr36_04255 [Pyricularia pennisetigena]|uniref:hypothetical protein n=1 Tax=Pyricularia pennisetigena TaxID=1578925 RepID=UPI001153D15E|nr:hypothetical protein PpBr36_04255 [Pyricularia pennisetigena]TLS27254.1 hypothetical protein PpBr36_04255 [Pyricularia pennisetigena]
MPATTSPPSHPQHWAGDINSYLAENKITCKSATPITAGTSCYLWRLDGFHSPLHPAPSPAVLKCADSTPKYSDDAVSPARLAIEVRALNSPVVAAATAAEPSVRVPTVLQQTENGFIMSWAGDVNLLEAFAQDQQLDYADVGARVGKWLGNLQTAGVAEGPGGFDPVNPELGRFYNPGGFLDKLVQSALPDPAESEAVLAALRGVQTARTLTAWDFRPMNTLLSSAGGPKPDLYIVDWELSQFGEAVGDVAMWAVEAMVLEAKHGDRGMLAAFLQAYRLHSAGIIDEAFKIKAGMLTGVMLVYFMRIAERLWGCTEDEVAAWRERAIEFLRAGANKNWEFLESSEIGILMG